MPYGEAFGKLRMTSLELAKRGEMSEAVTDRKVVPKNWAPLKLAQATTHLASLWLCPTPASLEDLTNGAVGGDVCVDRYGRHF
jgi:hypothetical protein